MTAPVVVLDPARPGSEIVRTRGTREVFIIDDPITHLWNRWCDLDAAAPQTAGFAAWAEDEPPNAVTRALACRLGVEWYRSRVDDVLAAMDEAWIVARSDHLTPIATILNESGHLDAWLRRRFVVPDLERSAVLSIRSRHAGDRLIFELAGWYEQRSYRRLGLETEQKEDR